MIQTAIIKHEGTVSSEYTVKKTLVFFQFSHTETILLNTFILEFVLYYIQSFIWKPNMSKHQAAANTHTRVLVKGPANKTPYNFKSAMYLSARCRKDLKGRAVFVLTK